MNKTAREYYKEIIRNGTIINFRIPIRPIAMQSARFTTRSGKIISYQPRKITEAKKFIQNYIKYELQEYKNLFYTNKDIILCVVFGFKSKKNGFRNIRPDLDNLLKFIIDAMKGIVYQDDSQIVYVNATKINAEEDFIDIKLIIGT